MASLEIHPLTELRDEAARLLGERFTRQRAAEPLLPEVDDFAAHVPVDDDGLVATRAGKAVAYLAGTPQDGTATVGFAGHAASEPEALRDLYAVLAERWAVSRFSVAVPAGEQALIDAWFRLAFGCQFIWGVRETATQHDLAVQLRHGVGVQLRHGVAVQLDTCVVRPSTRDDLEALAGLDELLWLLQARSPSFSGRTPPSRDELRASWNELWDDAALYTHFVAEQSGRTVGHVLLYRRPEGDLRVPADNIDLAQAATLDDVRGSGVGVALTAHVLAWARDHGFHSMTADWRSVNLLSSRFWPHRGFRPQYLRLYRAVP
jgi:GNAT superfamily N-acetyltransferase